MHTMAALCRSRLSPEARLLVFALQHCDNTGREADTGTLARWTGLRRSTVNRYRGNARRLIDIAPERWRRGARTGPAYYALTRRQRRTRSGAA